MKKINTLFLSVSLTLLLGACAVHSGIMTGNASISGADFNIVDVAVGTAKTTKVFGIGGLKSDALVLEAKRNLYSRYPLKKGQALANVTVDFKRSSYFIVFTTKVTISADIIDFNETPARQEVYYQKEADQLDKTNSEEPATEEPATGVQPQAQQFQESEPVQSGDFELGEEVYIKNANKASKAKIIQMKKNKYIVQILGEANIKTRSTNDKNLYKIKNAREFSENEKFNVEDIVKFTTYGTGNPPTQIVRYGSIVAMGKKGAVVKYIDDNKEEYIVMPYKQLRKR